MTDIANAALEGLVADTRARIAGYEAARDQLRNTLLGQGHVVAMPGGLYLTITTEPDEEGVRRVIDADITPNPTRATHLTREDAERVAADTRNGLGQHGVAMHITDAIEKALEGERRSLEALHGKEVTDAQ